MTQIHISCTLIDELLGISVYKAWTHWHDGRVIPISTKRSIRDIFGVIQEWAIDNMPESNYEIIINHV